VHSGGNDRFCTRLKTDISASNSGLWGRTRSCLTFLERGRRDESKMVRHDLRWPWRPELKAEMSVFNLAQKRSFPPLWSVRINALINIFIYTTMHIWKRQSCQAQVFFQSSIFGAATRLEPTTHRVVLRYWSSAPHADLRMVRSHIGHYNQWGA
jgi:hypothetical protein